VAAVAYLPKFQPQLNANDPLGPLSCTAYATAMQIDAATLGTTVPTGKQVRAQTGDTTGGLNLAQADAAAQHWNVDLDVRYRLPFADFIHRVEALNEPAQLQGGYGPIADSPYDAGNGFRGNHDILVMPGRIVLDPLADGRYPDVYRYKGDAYPADLLERFAGRLNLGNGNELGFGLVYAAFSTPAKPWTATCRPLTGLTTRRFTRYFVALSGAARIITGHEVRLTRGFSLPCTKPVLVFDKGGQTKRSLVKITAPGKSMDGWWVSSKWASQ
jgi:hypothetical protein